jgi:pimeloyl-ACP methyl ester carboxylesterase
MGLRWIAGLSVGLALALAAPTSGAPASAKRPIYFIHGWNTSANTDCGMWITMMKSFQAWGLKGTTDLANRKPGEIAFHTVGYYHGDKRCNTRVDANGNHASALPQQQVPLPGPQPHREGSHTTNTPIEHIAMHLAWNIYDSYSSRDLPVDVVAHSMGGLIIRYALAATRAKLPGFPPKLLVEDVVSLGTPHGGSRGHRFAPSLQGSQMDPGSSFIKTLVKDPRGFNPQGANGTDWTAVGSDDDTPVAADRAVGTDRDRDPRNKYLASRHKVWYTAVNHIEHSDYYKISTKNSTAVAWVALAGKRFSSHPLAIVYPMRLTFFALGSPNS